MLRHPLQQRLARHPLAVQHLPLCVRAEPLMHAGIPAVAQLQEALVEGLQPLRIHMRAGMNNT